MEPQASGSGSGPGPGPGQAKEWPLPSAPIYSIEYPGYVQKTSVPQAVRNLGGQSSLDNAFRRATSKNESLLELNMQPGNPFAHPIPGETVITNNILLKVVKRKRRRLDVDHEEPVGEYTVEAVGVIPKTVRFRSMADYQYQPDMSDPVAKLRLAMDNMDVDSIMNYRIPEEKEVYMVPVEQHPEIDPQLKERQDASDTKLRSNLRLFPPPLFSRQTIPLNYNFKANPMSTETVVINEQGEEKKRLINRTRWKSGTGPPMANYPDPTVPDKPPPNLEVLRSQVEPHLVELVKNVLEERPIWTRASLLNQFTAAEAREIINARFAIPLACYTFVDGPWRDTLIKYGYDPRQDPNARFYQRLYFRNINHPIARASVVPRRQESRQVVDPVRRVTGEEQRPVAEGDSRQSHIFDGTTLTRETAAFQLCDIHDPMLKEMIEDEEDLREAPDERDGWYSTHAFESIKTVLRHKFFCLLEGYVATDEECRALLSSEPRDDRPAPTNRVKPKWGKHNMAKGALMPEAAAAARLRATLERNAKNFQGKR